MKNLWKAGDKRKGICPDCRRLVDTVFEYRSMDLENPTVTVPDVLVDVCQHCDGIVSIPWQSNERLQAARKRERARLHGAARIEARIPGELHEALRVIAAHFATREEAFRPLALRYYLRELVADKRLAKRVRELATSGEPWGLAPERISLRLTPTLKASALAAYRDFDDMDQSSLVRGLIAALWEDVFARKATKRLATLRELAEAAE